MLKKAALVMVGGKASNADASSSRSVEIANRIAEGVGATGGDRVAGQTAGTEFEKACLAFLQYTFPVLNHIRPGDWCVKQSGPTGIAEFEQYAHLSEVELAIRNQPELRVALGGDYIIKPDVVVCRLPLQDSLINANQKVVDSDCATKSAIREYSGPLPLLHASVSCKWTMRSDRAQNTRSEALNLIRNRKGRLPHIVVVTAEPLPSRIASIAMGTGDIDCVYHFALPELVSAVCGDSTRDAQLLDLMVEGKRLKDISDLPLDLAV